MITIARHSQKCREITLSALGIASQLANRFTLISREVTMVAVAIHLASNASLLDTLGERQCYNRATYAFRNVSCPHC